MIRNALAKIVSTGFTPPFVTWNEPSITRKFGCPNPAAGIGDRVAGSYPSGRFRPGAGRRSRHHVLRVGSVGDRHGGTGRPQPVGSALPQQLLNRKVVGVQPTAEPGDRDAQAVGHRGSSRTRESAEVTSCTGLTTRCVLGSRRRSPRLAASPCGPIRPAWRR